MSKDQEQTAHETKNINIIYNTYKKKYILNFKVGIKTEVDIFAVRYLLCSNQNFGEIFITKDKALAEDSWYKQGRVY